LHSGSPSSGALAQLLFPNVSLGRSILIRLRFSQGINIRVCDANGQASPWLGDAYDKFDNRGLIEVRPRRSIF
jgi:hypothetical protein